MSGPVQACWYVKGFAPKINFEREAKVTSKMAYLASKFLFPFELTELYSK